MKILSVTFTNINSLAGTTRIDFTDPGFSPGVFLITGPTGSGKTTILDAITLALFGRTARQDSFTSGAEGANEAMNRDSGFCSSEVEFAGVDGRRYRAVWSQVRARRKVGGRLQPVRRSLIDLDDGGRDISEHRKTGTSGLVCAKLGFTFEEFTRAVILEQGQFDSFLKANETERGAILEKATRTDRFTKAGRAVFAAFQRAAKAREKAEAELNALKKGVLDPEAQARISASYQSLLKEKEALSGEQDALRKMIDWQEQDVRLQERGKSLVEKRRAFDSGKEEARRLVSVREKARQARAVDGLHAEVVGAARALARSRENVVRKSDDVARREASLPELRGLAGQAAAQLEEARGEMARAEPAIRRARELDGEIREIRRVAKSARKALADSRARLEKAREELAADESGKGRLERLLQFAEAYRDGKAAAVPEFSTDPVVAAVDGWKKAKADSEAAAAGLAALEKEDHERAIRSEQAEKDWPDLSKAHEECVDRAEQALVQARVFASLADQRAKLVEGEPCPLCGAVGHPYARPGVHVEGFDEAERKLEEAKASRDAARARIDALRGETSRVHRKVERMRLACKGLQNEISTSGARVEQRIRSIRDKVESLAESLDRRRKSLSDCEEDVRAKADEAASAAGPLPSLQVRREAIPFRDPDEEAKRLQGLVDERNERNAQATRAHDKAKQELAAARDALAEARQDAADKERASGETLAEFRGRIGAMGFADEAAWREARLADDVFDGTERAVSRRENDSASLAALEKAYGEDRDLHARGRPGEVLPLDAAREKLAENKAKLDRATSESGSLKEQLDRNRNDEKECAAAQGRFAAASSSFEKWKNLNKWLGGTDGRNFRVYAQGRTLDRLLRAATPHLASMSGNRYSFVWNPGSGTLEPQIVDHFLGDEVREVTNLSGGETFMVSLSLTLGLSRLSGDHFSVGSLFLDEGFGTLDESCLQLALDTLSKLHSEGCLVGIISHVEAVKEFIPCRIEVKRTGPGAGVVSGPGVTAGPARP